MFRHLFMTLLRLDSHWQRGRHKLSLKLKPFYQTGKQQIKLDIKGIFEFFKAFFKVLERHRIGQQGKSFVSQAASNGSDGSVAVCQRRGRLGNRLFDEDHLNKSLSREWMISELAGYNIKSL
ncbi:MAG: hypothetical protein ABF868_09175 [Sporolactobacillus sp.]